MRKTESLTTVWRQWGTTNKVSTNCIYLLLHQYGVQHSALVLKFIINNSYRLLYWLDEDECPTE